MEIEDVVDSQTFEEYLATQRSLARDQIARRAAFGIAVRNAPLALHFYATRSYPGVGGLSALPIFCALCLVYVAVTTNSQVSSHAIDPIGKAAASTAIAAKNSSNAAAFSAHAVAYSADSLRLELSPIKLAVLVSENAEQACLAVAGSKLTFWAAVRGELEACQKNFEDPFFRKDYQTHFDEVVRSVWVRTKHSLTSDKSKNWSFWISWFERVISGKDVYPGQLAAILNTLNIDKLLGEPAKVNALFAEIVTHFDLDDFVEKNPYGHRAVINLATDKLQLVPREPTDMSKIVAKARRFLREFGRRCSQEGGHNQFGEIVKSVLDPEIAALRKKLSRYTDDPQSLHDEIVRSVRHMRRRLREERHEDFSAALSLFEDLDGLTADICLISEPVRRAVDRKLIMTVERSTEVELAMAALTCHGLEMDGEGQMRAFAAISKKVLLNPEADIEEKKLAWQFAESVSVRASRAVLAHDAKEPEKKTGIGKKLKNASDVAVALDKLGDVGQEAIQEGYLGMNWLSQFIGGLPGGGP